jgi:hypothetical protein
MSNDFPLVRAAFADSIPGRILRALTQLLSAAWGSAVVGQAFRSVAGSARAASKGSTVASIAGAVAIASAMQPLLITLMPLTVVPALPWPAFLIVAGFAAAIAWRPEPFVSAWANSWLARRIRR